MSHVKLDLKMCAFNFLPTTLDRADITNRISVSVFNYLLCIYQTIGISKVHSADLFSDNGITYLGLKHRNLKTIESESRKYIKYTVLVSIIQCY